MLYSINVTFQIDNSIIVDKSALTVTLVKGLFVDFVVQKVPVILRQILFCIVLA